MLTAHKETLCVAPAAVFLSTIRAVRRAEHARRFPRCPGYFGAARNEAGGPGSFKFFPVSVTCVPSIFRTEMLLSR
jgi:hypothetical protein